MAIFVDFVTGRYTGTYDAVDIGITRNGYEVAITPNYETIAESDLGGESVLDMVYLGGNCTVRCESKEYKAGSVTPFWPWGNGVLGRVFSSGSSINYPVGRLASDLAKALALTAVTGTPAAVSNAGSSPGRPTSLTGTYSIIAPGQSGQLFLNPKLRHVPLFMQLLPYPSATGDYRHFVTT